MKYLVGLIISLSLSLLSNCMQSERSTIEGGYLPTSTSGIEPSSVVSQSISLMNEIFPATGPYALSKEEKTALELNMYHRYDEGYYDAEGKVMQANQLLSVMAEAEEEDGLSYHDLQTEFLADVEERLGDMPEDMLRKLRLFSANSMLVSEEIRRSEEFAEAGIDPELMKRSFERMQQMHRIVTDELSRRGEE